MSRVLSINVNPAYKRQEYFAAWKIFEYRNVNIVQSAIKPMFTFVLQKNKSPAEQSMLTEVVIFSILAEEKHAG